MQRIIQFAVDNAPQVVQFMLGSVRLHDATYAGERIELVDKRRLLRAEEYDDVHTKFEPLLNSRL